MSNITKGRLKDHLCYLVGPIDHDLENCKAWRRAITPKLNNLGVKVIDPTNSVFCSEDDSIAVRRINVAKNSGNWEQSTEIAKEIVRRDLRAIDLSSFIVAYIDTDIFSCGSIVELSHAAQQRKPVVLVCKQGKSGVPNFLWGLLDHNMFFGDWDSALEYINDIHTNPQTTNCKRWKFLDWSRFNGNT